MARQDEEHQRHREMLAAVLLPYVSQGMGAKWDEGIEAAFKLADQLLAYSRP